MAKNVAESPSARLQEQLRLLQSQVSEPVAVSRRQLLEALAALQESLQELEVAEAELAQQNEELTIAREALEVERHRYQELFDQAPVAYLVTDDMGVIEVANHAASRLFGLSPAMLRAKPLPLLVAMAERPRFRAFLQDLRSGSRVRDAEVELEGLHSQRRTLVLLKVERDDDRPGRPVRLRWVLHDISESRAAEEELRASQERLRHAQRMETVGRLAGGIAHSFNNLLAAIAFHADLLLEPEGPVPDQRRHAEAIQNAGERAALLARQLLAFSRKQVLQPRSLDVSRNVADLLPMLRRLTGEAILLEEDLDPDAGWVHADLGQLVILNLVFNARDAMPEGGRLKISVCGEEIGKDGGGLGLPAGPYVRLMVADTGTGIAEEVRTHLFEPFFTTKDRDRGSGLGLATVYGIVRQSGGAIQVDTEVGKGSTFAVYLPRTEAPAEEPKPSESSHGEGSGCEVILLAEDEDNIREPAREVLESRGYTVLEARDALQALEVSRGWNGPIHLLVSDVVMPGMSGSQLAARLDQERPGTHVLFISGYSEDAIAQHGVLHAGRSFLQKPFPPGVLLRTVREILDRKGAECPATTSS
ncbi:MAG TPA: ATP-binding protein [Thermoanaerobaculia bacterium]|jgi:PAS domain S-box-containing protein|nr:ATP-binding protein [Thermoanaerobaculia bacterium]